MDPAAHRFRQFLAELRRRHVLRVVLAYAAGAWLVIQIGEATFDPLGLPSSAMTVLVVVALAGFPAAAVLAWFLSVAGVAQARPAEDGLPDGRSRHPGGVVPETLPAPTAPLVGRGRELEAAERMIREEGCRVLTVTGPAGVGKTRLLLELGQRLGPSFPNGVCFAPAGPLHSPEALPFLLAERLGLGFAPGEDPWSATLSFVRGKRLLLMVDNFEQLAAASERLGELVSAGSGVVLAVTSRERLGLKGESVLRLEGLAYPGPGQETDAGSYDAVRLFVQSARRVDHAFVLEPWLEEDVVRICRLVDGLPLALELAAGGTAVLSPAEIAREIEDRHDVPLGPARDTPPRHRSLRAAFESSWALLDPGEREAFRRLAIFHGGFTRQEAGRVAGADLPVLARLVNKSLLRRQESGRFDMLEIVRQFGEEKLAADPGENAAVRDLHAEYCAELLEALVRRSDAGEARAALAELDPDTDNVRAAWSWMVERRDGPRLGRSTDGLFRLWETRGWIHEGRELFRRAADVVARPGGAAGDEPSDPRLLGRLLARQGALAQLSDAPDDARVLLERALALLSRDQDPRDVAIALCSLSFVARVEGDFEREHTLARESLEIYRSLGDPAGMATALNSLGAHTYMLGRYEEAKAHYTESIALFRQAGDGDGLLKPLNNLAGVALAEKDYAEARRLLEETLEHHRRRQNRRSEALALQNLGLVACQSKDYARAERLLVETIGLTEGAYPGLLAHALSTLGAVRVERGDGRTALPTYRKALDSAVEARDLPLALTIVIGLARVHARGGRREPALQLLQVVRAHPACDEDTRRDADTLLAELDADPAAGPPPGEPLDLEGVRDLALQILVAAG